MKAARIFLIGAALAVATTAPAVASPTTGMTQARMTLLKERGHLAIQRRLNELDRLTALVNGATHLTSSDRSTLLSKLSSDRSGLQSLDTKIQGDTDGRTLRNDLASIVTGYRIYVLVAPQVHIVVASDRIAAFVSLGNTIAAKIQAKIDAEKGNGKDVKAAQAALDDMKKQLADASAAVAGVASSVIALTPSGYPGNRTTLLDARSSILTARAHLVEARADAHAAVNALASALGIGGGAAVRPPLYSVRLPAVPSGESASAEGEDDHGYLRHRRQRAHVRLLRGIGPARG